MVLSKVGLLAVQLESGNEIFEILFMFVIKNVKNCILTSILYMTDADSLLLIADKSLEGLIMVPSLVQ